MGDEKGEEGGKERKNIVLQRCNQHMRLAADRQTQTDRWTDRWTDRQTDRWTNRQIDKQTDRQTD